MEEPLKILIIDDDQVDRMMVGRMLKAAGLHVKIDEASDGATGLESLSRQQADFIFLDYQFPREDGLTILRKARASSIKIPIIAARKKLEIYFDYPREPQEPLVVFADYTKLQQVFLNLLSNAIKFTHQGSITVSARREGERCHFSICDMRIGIDPADQKRLFKKFVQVDGSSTRKYGGTGVGLVISRAFMEQMGGTITLHSEGRGKGTSVYLSLPLASKH